MKAVVLHAYGGPDELKYEDVPDLTAGEGEVLVRQVATSINPIDWKMRSGAAKERFPVDFPAILGRDVAGIVLSVGKGVQGFTPGDKVIALGWATYAQLVVVKAADLAHLPAGMDVVESAALPLVTLTGEQLISRAVQAKPGETILVSGAVGSVGRSAVWVAKKAGATVIAGVRKKQLEQAREIGADEVLALDDEDAMSRLGLLDAVADTVGGETGQKLLGKVKQGGVFGSVLGPPANAKLHPTVRIAAMTAQPDPGALETLAKDAQAGRFTIPIDRMLPLEEAGEGQRAAEKGGVKGKILLLA